MTSQHSVVFAEPVRTAIGTLGGSLKDVPAPNLGAVAIAPQSPAIDFAPTRWKRSSWAMSCRLSLVADSRGRSCSRSGKGRLAPPSNAGERGLRPHASAPPRTEFFLKLMLRRAKNRHTALRLPGIRRLRIAATISSSVRSGWSAIRPSRNSACCSSGEMLPPLGFTVRIFWSEVGIEVLRPAQMTSCNGGRYKLRGRFSAEVGSRSSVIGRVNHPRRDLARSIGVCPA